MGLAVVGVVTSVLCLCVLPALAAGDRAADVERDSVSLDGRWDRLVEHGDAEVWRPAVAAELGPWKRALIPGTLLAGTKPEDRKRVGCVWARRRFVLDAARVGRGAVLAWNGIRYGATVWLNGRQLGHHAPIGPNAMLVPPGLLKRGRNELVLKVLGQGGLPRSQSGYPLIPVGSGTQRWGHKDAAIYDDIRLDFYDRAHLKWVLAVPDVKAGAVTFRIWLDGAEALPPRIDLTATVCPADGGETAGSHRVRLATGTMPVELTVPIKNVKRWTPATPYVYRADLSVRADGRPCDAVRFSFGMREISVVKGRYRLNGRPLRLRGSNLVSEWAWGGRRGQFNRQVKSYIVDEARAMSLNCFRTHTLPPPTRWLDVADRHGTMILAEFPVLYNHANFRYTPAELEVFHRNALLDATGWVTKLWNHPSIVIWVLSNESRYDAEWEAGPYWRHVRALDPTRPCLRTGCLKGTPETVDVHTCNNYSRGAEGQAILTFRRLAAHKDPTRTLTNTEYMNHLASREAINTRWLGRADHPDEPLTYAEFAMEHTEALRRLNFDCILPYMYAPYTRLRGNNWRPDYPTPVAAALHSAMAPVLASLDLFDRNVIAGHSVTTRLALINETLQDVPATLDLCVTPRHPLFVPDEAALRAAVHRQQHHLVLKADTIGETTLTWPVPEKEGVYYLAAVLRRQGAKPVVSQRLIHAIDQRRSMRGLAKRRVVLLGGNALAERWLRAKGIDHTTDIAPAAGDVVLVWDASRLSEATRRRAADILHFARGGGRVAILNQDRWTWTALADFRLTSGLSSRAFASAGVTHPMLTGIDPDYLKRWNGLPGTIAEHVIDGPILERGERLLWMENPRRAIAVRLPVGKGEVLVSMLGIRGRAAGGATFDPVAERVLLNIIGR